MGIDNRQQKRIPYNQQALINNSLLVNAVDISESGVYVHTGRLWPLGNILDISMSIGSHPVNLKVRVQHCQEGIGMGLEFIDLSPEHKAQLKNFLKELKTKMSAPKKKKIMLVEDNELARRMHKSKLVLDGFTVFEAKNGIEAMKILQTEQPMDLAIIDICVEPMYGFETISLIRQMPQHKDIPVIAWAVKSTTYVMEQALNAGATIFLPKTTTSPIKMSENVKKLLGK